MQLKEGVEYSIDKSDIIIIFEEIYYESNETIYASFGIKNKNNNIFYGIFTEEINKNNISHLKEFKSLQNSKDNV